MLSLQLDFFLRVLDFRASPAKGNVLHMKGPRLYVVMGWAVIGTNQRLVYCVLYLPPLSNLWVMVTGSSKLFIEVMAKVKSNCHYLIMAKCLLTSCVRDVCRKRGAFAL